MSPKRISELHEMHIAKLLDGKRSASSGAADNDAGDVRASIWLGECKATMKQSNPRMVMQFEKIAKEAYESGLLPFLALRYYRPESFLANVDGWLDLIVILSGDFATLLKKDD